MKNDIKELMESMTPQERIEMRNGVIEFFKNFDESKVKRDEGGKFSTTGSGGSGSSAKTKGRKIDTSSRNLWTQFDDPIDSILQKTMGDEYDSDIAGGAAIKVSRAVSEAIDDLKADPEGLASVEIMEEKARNALKSVGIEGDDAKGLIDSYVEDIKASVPEAFKNSKEYTNAKDLPDFYFCRHMQPGTARYKDETILLDTTCMQKMAKTMPRVPVYINHQDVDVENIHQADGFVTECFYNPLDGWLWAKFMVISDDAKLAIQNGYSVSNAYHPTQFGQGGTKNNVEYDREVLDAEFSHLALVEDPRYEKAKVYTPDQYKQYQQELNNLLNNQ